MTLPHVTLRLFQWANKMSKQMPGLFDLRWLMATPFHNAPEYNQLKSIFKGMVIIEPDSTEIGEFADYFRRLTPSNNRRNPWFADYFEQKYKCRVNKDCEASHNQLHSQTYSQQLYSSQVIEAVYVYAHALKRAHTALCGGKTVGVCDDFALMQTERLWQYLINVSFNNFGTTTISFDENGNIGRKKYIISNIQLHGGSYRLQQVPQFEFIWSFTV